VDGIPIGAAKRLLRGPAHLELPDLIRLLPGIVYAAA
jgi:hypothetical protein